MRNHRFSRIFAVSLMLLGVAGWGQQPEPVQVPNEHYHTPEQRAGVVAYLENPDRIERLKPLELIAALDVQPGDRVADIGTGAGVLLPYLSKAVDPGGLVYAEDIYPDFLERAREKVQTFELENVLLLLGDELNPRLPPGEMDLAVMLDCYHHFAFPKAMLDHLRRALKSEGRIAIVDFFKRDEMRDHVRLDRDGVVKEVQRFGWKLEASPTVLPNQYILIFKSAPH